VRKFVCINRLTFNRIFRVETFQNDDDDDGGGGGGGGGGGDGNINWHQE
jgi:hypothetical protein